MLDLSSILAAMAEEMASSGGTFATSPFENGPTVGSNTSNFLSELELPTAYPSKPVTRIDIPEPGDVQSTFNYVYFTIDEKTNQGVNNTPVTLNELTVSGLEFFANIDRVPRFVRVTFTPPAFDTFSNLDASNGLGSAGVGQGGLLDEFGQVKVSNHIPQLMFESALSNAYFTNVGLMDTAADKSFYTSLSSSAVFSDMGGSVTQQSQGLQSIATPTTKGSLIRDALRNPQAAGFNFAESTTRQEVVSNPLSDVKMIQNNFNINNLIFGNLIKSSLLDQVNVYSDELSGITELATVLQNQAASSAQPGALIATEYQPGINVIHQERVYDSSSDSDTSTKEGSALIGYYVEKFEIASDGSLSPRPPVILNSPNITSFIDPAVRYGAAYVYKIRAVSLSRFESIRLDVGNGAPDQVIMSTALIASAGTKTTVICQERIAPPPPGDLKFKYEFKTDSLLIFWEFPHNPQRDIKRFQIFRRRSVLQPFTILAEYDFDDSEVKSRPLELVPPTLVTKMPLPKKFYRDVQFTKDSSVIYTLASVDARGLASNYSMQFRVSFDRFKNDLVVRMISKSGAPKPYPNIFVEGDTFADTMRDSGHRRIKLYFDPEFLKVTRKHVHEDQGSGIAATETIIDENLIAMQSPGQGQSVSENPNYKLQIINTDLQSSEVVDIFINDNSPDPSLIVDPPPGTRVGSTGNIQSTGFGQLTSNSST